MGALGNTNLAQGIPVFSAKRFHSLPSSPSPCSHMTVQVAVSSAESTTVGFLYDTVAAMLGCTPCARTVARTVTEAPWRRLVGARAARSAGAGAGARKAAAPPTKEANRIEL